MMKNSGKPSDENCRDEMRCDQGYRERKNKRWRERVRMVDVVEADGLVGFGGLVE